MSKQVSVHSTEEVHEISRKLEAEHHKKKNTQGRIEALEAQVNALRESHDELVKHYHEFVKATVQYLKEDAEEE